MIWGEVKTSTRDKDIIMKPCFKLCSLLFFIIFSFNNASATLIDRGGGLLYEDVLDITLLADLNPSKTNGGDVAHFWNDAVSFADNFTYYDALRDTTWDNWRLPTLNLVDPTCSIVSTFPDGAPLSMGYNCQNSEISHLFYNTLGGVQNKSIDFIHNSNYDLFANAPDIFSGGDNNYMYWTGVDHYIDVAGLPPSDADVALAFNMGQGEQFYFHKNVLKMIALPVMDGDVGAFNAVSEPATLWLMGFVVPGLLYFRKTQNKKILT